MRLAVVTLALVPVALFARACYNEKLTSAVASWWARAWQKHDNDARKR